jgi:hypothetical protein
MNTNSQSNPEQSQSQSQSQLAATEPVVEVAVLDEDNKPHFFMTRASGSRRQTGTLPGDDEKLEASRELRRMEHEGATTTEAVEYLLGRGWSTAAIREAVRYPSDTRGHKKGDQLLPQHVNAIRTRWMQKKAAPTAATNTKNTDKNTTKAN